MARNGVGLDEDAAKIVSSGGYYGLNVQRRRMRRHRLPAPGGLARRFWGDASANYILSASLRKPSPPHDVARQ